MLSARQKASIIAQRVVAAYLRDERRTDDFERALYLAEQRLNPCPIEELATGGESAAASKFLGLRAEFYRGRGCRQIGDDAWSKETKEIAATVTRTLARRFRGYLT